jgi:DNA-binding CsgD family transcriptional regulator
MQTNVLPGMLDSATEFFVTNRELKFIQNGAVKNFTDIPFSTFEIIKDKINQDINVKLALHDFHPTSEIKRLEQFISCRFGGLDATADIDKNDMQDGEYWNCPNRGTCPHEGILCKLPVYNNNRLTKQNVTMMQLTSTALTNDVIAEEMNLAQGTFHLLKNRLYKMLGNIQTKQECAVISRELNLI